MPLNTGTCPPEARGKRIHVQLFGGYVSTGELRSSTEAPGWPADGPTGCRWAISDPPHPFEIKRWKFV